MTTANELRQLSSEELRTRAGELRRAYFEMKSKLNTGVLDSTAGLGKARRDVARCFTLMTQVEQGKVVAVKVGSPAVKAVKSSKAVVDEGPVAKTKKSKGKKDAAGSTKKPSKKDAETEG